MEQIITQFCEVFISVLRYYLLELANEHKRGCGDTEARKKAARLIQAAENLVKEINT